MTPLRQQMIAAPAHSVPLSTSAPAVVASTGSTGPVATATVPYASSIKPASGWISSKPANCPSPILC